MSAGRNNSRQLRSLSSIRGDDIKMVEMWTRVIYRPPYIRRNNESEKERGSKRRRASVSFQVKMDIPINADEYVLL